MQQLGQLRLFSLKAWEKARLSSGKHWSPEIQRYAEQLEGYNSSLQQANDYEGWYAADVGRQNQESAKILHERKEMAQENFRGLELVIKDARAALKNILA